MRQEKIPPEQNRLLIIVAIVLIAIISSGVLITIIFEGSRPSITNNRQPKNKKAVVATPSPQPSSSVTPQPLFTDTFEDNHKGWYIGNVPGYTRVISENVLTLADTNHKILVESLPADTVFEDFTITTTFAIKEGDANDHAGIYVRGDSNLDHDYRIDIFGNNTYSISKEWLDTHNTQQVICLAGPSTTNALHPIGQENVLVVIMKGAVLTVLINGTIMNTIIDSDYTHGQIALFVANGETSNGIRVEFSSIIVEQAPEHLPQK